MNEWWRGPASLDDHDAARGTSEDLGAVHFLRFGRRHVEGPGGGGSGDVAVLMAALPEEGGEGLHALVPKVLVDPPVRRSPPQEIWFFVDISTTNISKGGK